MCFIFVSYVFVVLSFFLIYSFSSPFIMLLCYFSHFLFTGSEKKVLVLVYLAFYEITLTSRIFYLNLIKVKPEIILSGIFKQFFFFVYLLNIFFHSIMLFWYFNFLCSFQCCHCYCE